ncbi:hypothetical protein [Vibrio navarrensis]|uniref:hypothetical protein n=1 Tax=Vibrio navarrensis TaxID=29495 RepID=UPI0018DDFCB1|nr:hypothetical protein [Vibrio navarrensis]MBH9740068.1 hypothetical protein [Vibrio navarrensis]
MNSKAKINEHKTTNISDINSFTCDVHGEEIAIELVNGGEPKKHSIEADIKTKQQLSNNSENKHTPQVTSTTTPLKEKEKLEKQNKIETKSGTPSKNVGHEVNEQKEIEEDKENKSSLINTDGPQVGLFNIASRGTSRQKIVSSALDKALSTSKLNLDKITQSHILSASKLCESVKKLESIQSIITQNGANSLPIKEIELATKDVESAVKNYKNQMEKISEYTKKMPELFNKKQIDSVISAIELSQSAINKNSLIENKLAGNKIITNSFEEISKLTKNIIDNINLFSKVLGR